VAASLKCEQSLDNKGTLFTQKADGRLKTRSRAFPAEEEIGIGKRRWSDSAVGGGGGGEWAIWSQKPPGTDSRAAKMRACHFWSALSPLGYLYLTTVTIWRRRRPLGHAPDSRQDDSHLYNYRTYLPNLILARAYLRDRRTNFLVAESTRGDFPGDASSFVAEHARCCCPFFSQKARRGFFKRRRRRREKERTSERKKGKKEGGPYVKMGRFLSLSLFATSQPTFSLSPQGRQRTKNRGRLTIFPRAILCPIVR